MGERTQISNAVIPKNVMFVPKSDKAPLMREAVPAASLAHGASGAGLAQNGSQTGQELVLWDTDQEWK